MSPLKSDATVPLINKENEIAPSGLGWLPYIFFSGALGILSVSIANTVARQGNASEGNFFFWFGLLIIFIPVAFRLIAENASRQERLALLILLGLALYAVKVLQSPDAFTFHDELVHWRTAQDILSTGHLFKVNSILPASPVYPGLEIITTAFSNLTGLSVFASAMFLLALARLVLSLSLFLFYEQIIGSTYLAALATFFYMVNPNFVFFDSQFAYETLSIPLLTFFIFAAVRTRLNLEHKTAFNIVTVLVLFALVITHHLTSIANVAWLFLWILTAFIMARLTKSSEKEQKGPIWIGILTLILTFSWLLYIAPVTLSYLRGPTNSAFGDALRLLRGESLPRRLFTSYSGTTSPLLEQILGYGSILFVILVLPLGLLYTWRHYRRLTLPVTLGILVIFYPISLSLRISTYGAEISNRAAEFLFFGICLILAITVGKLPFLKTAPGKALYLFWVSVIFTGGVIVGYAPSARLPGPYLVAADQRSIEPEGINSALWAKETLGPENHFTADRINSLMMEAYGDQHVTTVLVDSVNPGSLFFATNLDNTQYKVIKDGNIHYLLADQRLTTGLPLSGFYFESNEPGALEHKQPISLSVLTKFDTIPGVSRIFDSGNIRIYDIGVLANAAK